MDPLLITLYALVALLATVTIIGLTRSPRNDNDPQAREDARLKRVRARITSR